MHTNDNNNWKKNKKDRAGYCWLNSSQKGLAFELLNKANKTSIDQYDIP